MRKTTKLVINDKFIVSSLTILEIMFVQKTIYFAFKSYYGSCDPWKYKFHQNQSDGHSFGHSLEKRLLHQTIWKTLFQDLTLMYLRRLIDGNFIPLNVSLLLRSDIACVLCSLLVPTRGFGLKGWKSLYNTIIPSVSLEKALANNICSISFPAISDGISRNRHFKTPFLSLLHTKCLKSLSSWRRFTLRFETEFTFSVGLNHLK